VLELADPRLTDLAAVEIAGLAWRESAPAFESIAIDERGEPLRIVTSDPRVFVAHKYWLSKRSDREAIKRRRDGEQAKAIATLIATHMPQLPFEWAELRMLPRELVRQGRFLRRHTQFRLQIERLSWLAQPAKKAPPFVWDGAFLRARESPSPATLPSQTTALRDLAITPCLTSSPW
jgi:hypothetical protein